MLWGGHFCPAEATEYGKRRWKGDQMRSVLKMTFWYTKTGVFGFEERKTRPNRLPQAPRPISAFVYFSGPYFYHLEFFLLFSCLFKPAGQFYWAIFYPPA